MPNSSFKNIEGTARNSSFEVSLDQILFGYPPEAINNNFTRATGSAAAATTDNAGATANDAAASLLTGG